MQVENMPTLVARTFIYQQCL